MTPLTGLIVDDSATIRRIIGRMLVQMGIEVSEAANGCEALELLERSEMVPELALIDWNMPEMDGLELIRELRTRPRFDQTRLMMVTSEVEIDRVSEALEAGADEYLMKPFNRDVLMDKLILLGVNVQVSLA
jgi:two-component system chemotaxis response regulator CheY